MLTQAAAATRRSAHRLVPGARLVARGMCADAGDGAEESLDSKFARVARERGPQIASLPNDDKLRFYALFKQATEGDVQGKRPSVLHLKDRAKWDAWKQLEGESFSGGAGTAARSGAGGHAAAPRVTLECHDLPVQR